LLLAGMLAWSFDFRLDLGSDETVKSPERLVAVCRVVNAQSVCVHRVTYPEVVVAEQQLESAWLYGRSCNEAGREPALKTEVAESGLLFACVVSRSKGLARGRGDA